MTGERARIARCYYDRPFLSGRICPHNGSSAKRKKAPMSTRGCSCGPGERHGSDELVLLSDEPPCGLGIHAGMLDDNEEVFKRRGV
jgi:hypothetical protein